MENEMVKEYARISTMAAETDLKVAKVRQIAKKCGAVRKVGNVYIVHRKTFLDYVNACLPVDKKAVADAVKDAVMPSAEVQEVAADEAQ